jgi:hypothetical protein
MPVKFVSREAWGAKPPKSVTRRSEKDLDGVAVHFFDSPRAPASHDGCAANLRSVQHGHMKPGGLKRPEGGADIAYNHGVCPHGVAFTLRGFGVQTGANGTTAGNRAYAAVVYMGGTGDPLTEAAKPVLAEVIRMWQAKGAGPLVKPHQFFVGTGCPGPELLSWMSLTPRPWTVGGGGGALLAGNGGVAADETPDWLIDFIFWRLADDGDPLKRPKHVPKRVPESAWEAAAQMHRMAALMGPQESFLDWAQWRRDGHVPEQRPRNVPERIPEPWWEALASLERSFKGVGTKPAPGKPKPPPTLVVAAVTTGSKLLSRPRAPRVAAERYLLGRAHGKYTDADVRKIAGHYFDLAPAVGLDPLLVVGQMVLETGSLTSFWSQRPRRNMAGIGVTGKPKEGLSFANLEVAVRAHVGRLLAYALKPGVGTAGQKELIAEALAHRPLPDEKRGKAPTLQGLAGTWAEDGEYADKIRRVSNEIGRQA